MLNGRTIFDKTFTTPRNTAIRINKKFGINVKLLKTFVIVAVFLGVLNVLSNIVLPLSILHLAIADFLWISYIYVSIDLAKNNLFINSL